MDDKHGFIITERDRMLLMWQASMYLVRCYEAYAGETKDKKMKMIFEEFAQDEGEHASCLHEMLLKIER